MAAGSSEVLREYLVSLGFRVDARGQRNFDNAVTKSHVKVFALAGAIAGLIGATTKMVVNYARDMEKMYYASKKADAPVAQLKALQYGYKQIGLTGEQATATVEGLARSMRMNPGMVALLQDLGVPVKGRTKDKVLIDLITALRSMPEHIAIQYANLFGIDPDQLKLLEDGLEKLKESTEQRAEMARQAGVDTEEATAAALEYAQALTEIKERATVLKDALAVALLPYFRKVNTAIQETFVNASGWLNFARNSDPATFFGEFKKRFIEGWREKFGGGAAAPPTVAPAPAPAAPASTGPLPLGLRNNNPGNLRAGLGQTGTNSGFATFGSSEDGLAAMARQLMLYQKRDRLKTLEDIIGKYAPSSENNTKAYVDSVSKNTGFLPNEYIDLSKAGNLSAIMGAMVQHENGRNPFNTAQLDSAAQRGITMTQKTEIKVYAPDAAAAGQAVAREQRGVNADMARNLGTRKVE